MIGQLIHQRRLSAVCTHILVSGRIRMPSCFTVLPSVELTTCREGKNCSGARNVRTPGGDFEVCAPGARAGTALHLLFTHPQRVCCIVGSVASNTSDPRTLGSS